MVGGIHPCSLLAGHPLRPGATRDGILGVNPHEFALRREHSLRRVHFLARSIIPMRMTPPMNTRRSNVAGRFWQSISQMSPTILNCWLM